MRLSFFLSLDPNISPEVKHTFICNKGIPERFEILGEETIYWSQFINKAIEAAKDFTYLLSS